MPCPSAERIFPYFSKITSSRVFEGEDDAVVLSIENEGAPSRFWWLGGMDATVASAQGAGADEGPEGSPDGKEVAGGV